MHRRNGKVAGATVRRGLEVRETALQLESCRFDPLSRQYVTGVPSGKALNPQLNPLALWIGLPTALGKCPLLCVCSVLFISSFTALICLHS